MRKATPALLLLSCFLVACGGGSGEGGSTTSSSVGSSSASAGAGGAGGFGSVASQSAGSVGTAASAGSGGAESCSPVTLGKQLDSDSAPGGSSLVFELAGLDSTEQDLLYLEFFDVAGPQKSGTFDLSLAPEDNYTSCAHCVLVFEDFTTMSPTKFFPVSGTMTVTTPDTALNAHSKGLLAELVLREVTLAKTVTTPVPKGRCLRLSAAMWDSTVP